MERRGAAGRRVRTAAYGRRISRRTRPRTWASPAGLTRGSMMRCVAASLSFGRARGTVSWIAGSSPAMTPCLGRGGSEIAHFPQQKELIPGPPNRPYLSCALFNRGRRRSRRSKAEQGAAPDNVAAMERREAQGSSQEPARPGTPTPSRLGSRKLGAMTPADRKAGEGSLASSLAPPGAPSPRERGKEIGIRATPAARKPSHRAAERWLKPHLGCGCQSESRLAN